MRMKLILLLTSVCTAAGFMQKRSSVLTDESKRILDIFDFSNFDKQEALNYIDRQRFENLIRGKRSKWNFNQNLLNSTLGDYYNDYNSQQRKYDSKGAESFKFARKGLPRKQEKLNVKSMSKYEINEEETSQSFQLDPAKHGLRRIRSAKTNDDSDENLEQKSSGLQKNNGSVIEENEFLGNSDGGVDDENEGNKNEGSEKRRRKKKKKKRKRHHWSKWSEWSPCSVTCGKGRKIRSRKCIAKSCETGEMEMGEKTCQLPACSLFDKLFSFLT